MREAGEQEKRGSAGEQEEKQEEEQEEKQKQRNPGVTSESE